MGLGKRRKESRILSLSKRKAPCPPASCQQNAHFRIRKRRQRLSVLDASEPARKENSGSLVGNSLCSGQTCKPRDNASCGAGLEGKTTPGSGFIGCGMLFPAAAALFLVSAIRIAVLAAWRRGIFFRGRFRILLFRSGIVQTGISTCVAKSSCCVGSSSLAV